MQKLQAVCTDMAGFNSSFDGAARLLAVAAVVEPALADEAAHIGEIVGQGGYLKMVQAEFLQTGGIDDVGGFV